MVVWSAAAKEETVMQIATAWSNLPKFASVVLVFAVSVSAPAQGPCSWSPLGSGVGTFNAGLAGSSAFAMTEFQGELYVGGSFLAAGAAQVNGIARWMNGPAWLPVGGGTLWGTTWGQVRALEVYDFGTGPSLYAAGFFDVPGNSIARWDGSAWSPLGGGLTGGFMTAAGVGEALAVFDDGTGPALYAAGNFTVAGGAPANFLARWNGAFWSPLPGGDPSFVPAELATYDDGTGPALYLGGRFVSAGGVVVNSIGRWNGSAWFSLAGGLALAGPFEPIVLALAVFDDGSGPALFVAGEFTSAGGVAAQNIAKWDGSTWSSLGGVTFNGYSSNPNNPAFTTIRSLAVHDDGTGPALYAAGVIATVGGTQVNDIARWDGVSWSAVGGGVGSLPLESQWIEALATYDDGSGPALHAAGVFTLAGGLPANNIAAWNCGSGISLSATQVAPGAPVYVNNANLTPGRVYYNLFSTDLCPGGPGTGPLQTFGGCVYTPLNVASIVGQLGSPVGTAPFHVVAPSSYVNWGAFNVPPVTVDAICIDAQGSLAGPTSPVVRITIQ